MQNGHAVGIGMAVVRDRWSPAQSRRSFKPAPDARRPSISVVVAVRIGIVVRPAGVVVPAAVSESAPEAPSIVKTHATRAARQSATDARSSKLSGADPAAAGEPATDM